MRLHASLPGLVLALAGTALAAPAPAPDSTIKARANPVSVVLPAGTIVGSANVVETFNGIPYADPPVGPLRLKPPRKLTRNLGTFDATPVAPQCPQMGIFGGASAASAKIANVEAIAESLNEPLYTLQAEDGQEDCLSVTVQRPLGTKPGDKLPVLFWIYGGGFMFGSTAKYDATGLLTTGTSRSQPFIYVSVNHRVGGWGFLAGAEILKDGSANLGLLDQRLGLEWVADNIAAFGGDPDKVTIWGQSAGSISVLDQIVLNKGDANYKGKPLFRAAIMNSGTITPTDPVDCPKAQVVYNTVVEKAGCAGKADTLDCLRKVDYPTFYKAANSLPGIITYQALALSYLPRPDGKALADSPDILIKNGQFHGVPMIMGNVEDEGTLFSYAQKDMGTTEKLVDYFAKYYFAGATRAQITELVNTYSPLPADGSPFRTGDKFVSYPGSKRLAAMLGDGVFTLMRRVTADLISKVKPSLPIYSYMGSYLYADPIFGAFGTRHSADLAVLFEGNNDSYDTKSSRAYYLNFLYNLDPNKGSTGFEKWPKWQEANQLLWINKTSVGLLPDNFRQSSYEFWKNNLKAIRF